MRRVSRAATTWILTVAPLAGNRRSPSYGFFVNACRHAKDKFEFRPNPFETSSHRTFNLRWFVAFKPECFVLLLNIPVK